MFANPVRLHYNGLMRRRPQFVSRERAVRGEGEGEGGVLSLHGGARGKITNR